jgi:hypothetical protein
MVHKANRKSFPGPVTRCRLAVLHPSREQTNCQSQNVPRSAGSLPASPRLNLPLNERRL